MSKKVEKLYFDCGFCGAEREKVKHIILGKYAAICDECVKDAMAVLVVEYKKINMTQIERLRNS